MPSLGYKRLPESFDPGNLAAFPNHRRTVEASQCVFGPLPEGLNIAKITALAFDSLDKFRIAVLEFVHCVLL